MLGHILLDGGHGQRTGRLDDAAGVDKNVLDGGADGVGVYRHELVDQFAADAKGLHPHQLDGGAVRKQADIRQRDAFVRRHRLHHGVRVIHLHPDDLDLGAQRLDVIGHTGNQPATTDGNKHRVQSLRAQRLQLAQDFHRNRALAGDHVRVVKRMDKRQAMLFLQGDRVGVSVRVAVAVQHHFPLQRLDRVNLELRGGGGHHHHSPAAQLLCAERHALGVVASRCANHPFFKLCRRQVRHFVVSPAQFEAEHRLRVLTLEQHGVAQAVAQCSGGLQCRLDSDVVHPCREDFFEVISRGKTFRNTVGQRASCFHSGFWGGCHAIPVALNDKGPKKGPSHATWACKSTL